jgi:hypothetical protein
VQGFLSCRFTTFSVESGAKLSLPFCAVNEANPTRSGLPENPKPDIIALECSVSPLFSQ